jgi:hypothetical protein
MTRSNLEHIIRAAGAIADDSDIIIVGSQSVLGQFPEARTELLISVEADVYPKNWPDRSDLIDGAIGEGSPFERQFRYYAHGFDASTSILPSGWEQRLVLVTGENTRFIRGWCLEVHDLAIAKLVAGRSKDLDFLHHLIDGGYVVSETLRERLTMTSLEEPAASTASQRLAGLLSDSEQGPGMRSMM